jgi:hypothetical protein
MKTLPIAANAPKMSGEDLLQNHIFGVFRPQKNGVMRTTQIMHMKKRMAARRVTSQ